MDQHDIDALLHAGSGMCDSAGLDVPAGKEE
jgi:hypothetical protein